MIHVGDGVLHHQAKLIGCVLIARLDFVFQNRLDGIVGDGHYSAENQQQAADKHQGNPLL